MPTYDYVCGQCGHELEIFHSMSDAPKRKCPACGKNKLQRRIGAGAGILFRGSGFYQTDYRSASYEASAKGDREGGTSDAAKPDATPSETKTEKKAATEAPKSEPTPPKPGKGGKKKAG